MVVRCVHIQHPIHAASLRNVTAQYVERRRSHKTRLPDFLLAFRWPQSGCAVYECVFVSVCLCMWCSCLFEIEVLIKDNAMHRWVGWSEGIKTKITGYLYGRCAFYCPVPAEKPTGLRVVKQPPVDQPE